MFGQLFDGIAAIEQYSVTAVDIGDVRVAGGGRHEAGVVGEIAAFDQSADIDDVRSEAASIYRQFD